MFKVADYLIQSQSEQLPLEAARLRPLDTRGGEHAAFSLWYLMLAVGKIVTGRMKGDLAGVHVNMAERMSLFRKGTLIVVCAALGVPTVLHLHAQMQRFYGALPPFIRGLIRWIFSLPQAVIVIGPATRKFVIEVLRVPEVRVRTIINGVPEGRREPGNTRCAAPHRVLFLGNLSDEKGVHDLLRALSEPVLDDCPLRLTVAGGGDVAGYVELARALGVDSVVRFEGWCDQSKVRRLLTECDLLVLPSHDEVLPLSILEALAYGVPVVTTPVGEIPSVLTDGVDAVFVQAGQPASIAAGMRKVLEDPVLRRSLSQNGRALYLRHLSLKKFFSSVATVHRRHFGVSGQLAASSHSAESA